MNRLNEYDIYYVEWLHDGEWVADTILMQKGQPPEPYCDECLKQEWANAKTNKVIGHSAYRLLALRPTVDSGKV